MKFWEVRLIMKNLKNNATLIIAAANLIMNPAASAVEKDAEIEGQYNLGGTGNIALPSGKWRVVDDYRFIINGADSRIKAKTRQTGDEKEYSTEYQGVILSNIDPDSSIPLIIYRTTLTAAKLQSSMCALPVNPKWLFLADEHGTLSTQYLSKCSRIWDIGKTVSNWMKNRSGESLSWWEPVYSHAPKEMDALEGEYVSHVSEIRQYKHHALYIESFIKIDKFKTNLEKLRSSHAANAEDPAVDIWRKWIAQLVEANTTSYIDGKPAVVPALNGIRNSSP
jgi:hypothetical protein